MNREFLLAQRAIFVLCLVLLTSCSTPCRQWILCEIGGEDPCFNSGRLILEPDSTICHLELELDRSQSGIRMYVNLLLLQAPPLPEDPQKTALSILFEDGESLIVYPYLLTGGQRLLLPPDVADFLIATLLEGRPFTIQIGRQNLSVIIDQFEPLYQRLLAIPISEK